MLGVDQAWTSVCFTVRLQKRRDEARFILLFVGSAQGLDCGSELLSKHIPFVQCCIKRRCCRQHQMERFDRSQHLLRRRSCYGPESRVFDRIIDVLFKQIQATSSYRRLHTSSRRCHHLPFSFPRGKVLLAAGIDRDIALLPLVKLITVRTEICDGITQLQGCTLLYFPASFLPTCSQCLSSRVQLSMPLNLLAVLTACLLPITPPSTLHTTSMPAPGPWTHSSSLLVSDSLRNGPRYWSSISSTSSTVSLRPNGLFPCVRHDESVTLQH